MYQVYITINREGVLVEDYAQIGFATINEAIAWAFDAGFMQGATGRVEENGEVIYTFN